MDVLSPVAFALQEMLKQLLQTEGSWNNLGRYSQHPVNSLIFLPKFERGLC